MTPAQLLAPVGLLEYLVDEQYLTAPGVELGGELCQPLALKIKVVQVDVQAAAVVGAEVLLGVLKQEGGLAYPSCALDANKPVVPVYLVHQGASNWSVGMFHKVGMCSEEGLHLLAYCSAKLM